MIRLNPYNAIQQASSDRGRSADKELIVKSVLEGTYPGSVANIASGFGASKPAAESAPKYMD